MPNNLDRVHCIRRHFRDGNALVKWYNETPVPHYNIIGDSMAAPIDKINEGLRLVTFGTVKHNEKMKALTSKFQNEIPSLARVWRADVAGFFPNVPAFLAGEPASMWAMPQDKVNNAPLRIWVGLACSGGITDESLAIRGTALAAFAVAMSERRTVLITPFGSIGTMWGDAKRDKQEVGLFSWDMGTSPISYAEVGAGIIEPDTARYLRRAVSSKLNPLATLHHIPGKPEGYQEPETLRTLLGAADDDLILPHLSLLDPIVNDPIGWIQRNIERYIGETE